MLQKMQDRIHQTKMRTRMLQKMHQEKTQAQIAIAITAIIATTKNGQEKQRVERCAVFLCL